MVFEKYAMWIKLFKIYDDVSSLSWQADSKT